MASPSNIYIADPFYKSFKQERLIDGHTIYLPDPPNKNNIVNFRLPTSKQKYIREDFPTEFSFKTFSPAQQDEHLNRWAKLRHYGQFFMNNGNLEYITGLHWGYLNGCNLGNNNYMIFIDSDRDFFYVWEYVVNTDEILGLIYGTNRGEGKTTKGVWVVFEHASSTHGAYSGMQSKTNDDMEVIFQEKLVPIWQNAPFFMQPTFSNSTNPKDELVFRTKGSMAEGAHLVHNTLNSRIDYKASVETAYDSKRLTRKYDDEVGKTKLIDVNRRFDISRECLQKRGIWTGKYFLSTTVEDEQDAEGNSLGIDSKSMKNFLKLWNRSKSDTLNANGMTDSGLITYFKPAYRGFGTFIDEYGYSDEEGAKAYIMNERSLKAGDDLLSYIRKYPFNEQEFFSAVEADSDFNPQLINDQMNWNNKYLQPPDPIVINSTFKLEWKNGVFGGDVEAIPSREGDFQILWHPLFPNRRNHTGGFWTPANKTTGVIGIDPIDKRKSETTRSKYAAVGLRWEEENPNISSVYDNAIVFRYNCRHDNPMVHHEDMLKACIYWGWEAMYESMVEGGINYFIEKGFSGYLALCPKEFNGGKPVTRANIGIKTRSENNRNLLLQNLMRFITSHVGENKETGLQGTVYYNEILQDFKALFEDKKGDWTKRDDCVAVMMALAAKYTVRKKIKNDFAGLGLNEFYRGAK